jgi:flagellar protein FlaG
MDISSIQSTAAASAPPKTERPLAAQTQSVVAESERKLAENLASEASVPREEASREEVEAAVATIQDFVQNVRRSLNFSLEEGGGRVVVKVTDAGSGDVIRQIPSEEALQLAENLSEVRSLLFKAEA